MARASASSLSERAVVVALVALGVELVQASLVPALARKSAVMSVSKLVPQRTWVADAAVEQQTEGSRSWRGRIVPTPSTIVARHSVSSSSSPSSWHVC